MSLFTKELWELRYRLIVMILLLIGVGSSILGYYELFIKSIDINQIALALKNSVIANYISPEIITKQLTELMNNIDLYVWSQWFGKNFMQLILLSAILLGFSSFAREREHNTNSFLLTNFTRSQVFWTKIYAGILSMSILVVIGCTLPVVMAVFKPFNFSIILAMKYLVQILPTALFLYAIITLFSVLAKDVVKPIVLGIIAFALLSIPGQINLLKGFYIYQYLTGANVFFYNQINFIAVIIISILTILIFKFTQKLYQHQDF